MPRRALRQHACGGAAAARRQPGPNSAGRPACVAASNSVRFELRPDATLGEIERNKYVQHRSFLLYLNRFINQVT